MRATLPSRAAFVLAGSVLLAAALDAQQAVPDAVRAAADGISSEQLAWDLARLASDDLLGRNTPSPGFDAAADYITARLERAGLTPDGDNGTFRQHYELRDTRVDTTAASITVKRSR